MFNQQKSGTPLALIFTGFFKEDVKVVNKIIVATLLLISSSSAFAEMACEDLFAVQKARPSEEQINTVIFDLAYLMSERYSKDPQVAAFAKSESQKKISELQSFMTISEIKAKLKSVSVDNSLRKTEQEQLRKNGNEILEYVALKNFLEDNGFKTVNSLEVGSDGFTPLTLAIKKGNVDLVKILLKNGANVNAKNDLNNTPLGRAAEHGNKEIVEILIRNGAKINARNYLKQTAFILAAMYGRTDVVRILFENGAHINAKNFLGETALNRALYYKEKETIKYLNEIGARE